MINAPSGKAVLLFTIPKSFSSQDSYLGVDLGTRFETAYWHII